MEEREGGWNIERWGGRGGMRNYGAKGDGTRRGILEQGEGCWNREGTERIKIQYLEITILTIGATGLNILGVY